MRSTLSALSILLLALPALPLTGQTPRTAAPALELPAGARAVGLGGAAQLGVDDPDHLFSHPAWLGRAGFRVAGWIMDEDASIFTLATGTSALGGRVAVGIRAAEWTGVAPGTEPGGLDRFIGEGEVGRNTTAGTVGYARDLLGVQVGVTATLLSERADEVRERDVAFDLGLGHEVAGVNLSAVARNLGRDLDFASEVALPTTYEVGAGTYGIVLGPVDLGAAARVGVREDDHVVAGGGLEIGYFPIQGRTFIGRVGVQSVPDGDASHVTLGGSFRGDELVIDYAWREVDGTSLHVITLGWR
ncbi:MAG: hypothetical protein RQ745_08295 [Longimicrobiales bacterium]|nr:hypothetical protein [Longimicrobiales bacterium]